MARRADGTLKPRGTSNRIDPSRGTQTQRRMRKLLLFLRDGIDGVAPCAFGCGKLLVFGEPEGVVYDPAGGFAPATVDRHPIPGCMGGTYDLENTRLACPPCNYTNGGGIRRELPG